MATRVKHEERKDVNVRNVNVAVWRKARRAAFLAGMSMAQWIEALIEKACGRSK